MFSREAPYAILIPRFGGGSPSNVRLGESVGPDSGLGLEAVEKGFRMGFDDLGEAGLSVLA